MKKLKILEDIKKGDSKVIASIYKDYRKEFMIWMNRTYACEEQVAIEIFQESVVILYENVVQGKLEVLSSSLKTYLFSIAKNRYFRRTKEEGKVEFVDLKEEYLEEYYTIPTISSEDQEQYMSVAEKNLRQLGETCQKILTAFYYHKMNMKDIAENYSLSNADSAKSQKTKCLRKLRKLYKDTVLSLNLNYYGK